MVLNKSVNSLIILYSYHHRNTRKIAEVFAHILDAEIKIPNKIEAKELQEYNLVGFGSGIYGGKHHKLLLELADKIPQVKKKKAFIFSTDGTPRSLIKNDSSSNERLLKNHNSLRERLHLKGYNIIDEFICAGWNTNSFLKIFGGINKGRPNEDDLIRAEKFAQNLLQYLEKEKQTKHTDI